MPKSNGIRRVEKLTNADKQKRTQLGAGVPSRPMWPTVMLSGPLGTCIAILGYGAEDVVPLPRNAYALWQLPAVGRTAAQGRDASRRDETRTRGSIMVAASLLISRGLTWMLSPYWMNDGRCKNGTPRSAARGPGVLCLMLAPLAAASGGMMCWLL